MESHEFSYPAMLRLKDKKCVIIGGGAVAARKLASLLASGARVSCVALDFTPELLDAAGTKAELIRASYDPAYVKDAFITVAATSDKNVNRKITQDAPFLVNNITEPDLSNFIVPSSFTRGSITVAVATGGMPAFTRLLKGLLLKAVTPELSEFNAFLYKTREELKAIPSTSKERGAFWRSVLTEELLEEAAAGDAGKAKEKISDAVSSFRVKSQNGPR